MEAATTIHLRSEVHSDSHNLRPSISMSGGYHSTLTINFGRRGKVRFTATNSDIRCLAKWLNRLADAHAVACGDRQVAP